MTPTHPFLQPASDRRIVSTLRTALEPFAIQDWIVGSYLALLCCGAYVGTGPLRDGSLLRVTLLFAGYVVAMVLVRRQIIKHRVGAALLYRVAIYGTVQVSYFFLRDLLAAATTRSFDAALHGIDMRLFGVEPAVWAERFVSATTSEWFAFFYFSYFVVLAIHVLPMLFLSRRRALLAEFGFVMLTVYCVAQSLYLFVPAFGPHRSLASVFENELPNGFWYRAVLSAVHSGGAERDAFPSLHTAGPAALAMFSFRHRGELPFKYTWPVTAFFAANIIIATVFLRWHYVIDVIGGLTLAFVTVAAAGMITRNEARRRQQAGVADVWPPYGDPATHRRA